MNPTVVTQVFWALSTHQAQNFHCSILTFFSHTWNFPRCCSPEKAVYVSHVNLARRFYIVQCLRRAYPRKIWDPIGNWTCELPDTSHSQLHWAMKTCVELGSLLVLVKPPANHRCSCKISDLQIASADKSCFPFD